MFKPLKKLIKFLNSEADPSQIALGAILGLFGAYLSPAPLNLIIIILAAFIIKCNLGVFFLCLGLFKALTFATDPLADVIGLKILTLPALEAPFTAISSIPVAAFTGFNNSVIVGSFILALALSPVAWFGTLKFTDFYRKKLRDKIKKYKIIQILSAGSILDKGDK